MTSGATEAIFSAIQGVCDAGDEVVLFEPYYDSYKASVVMAGRRAARRDAAGPGLELRPGRAVGRVFSADAGPAPQHARTIRPARSSRRRSSRSLAALCRERDVLCITDEVYEHLVYEGRHVPMATLPGMRERTITISSFGKTFSLTGWKIGWAAAPPELTAAVRAAHQFVTFATATPLQHGAAAALQAGPEYYETLRADYRGKRDYLVRELSRIGFAVRPPQGTYFACADFRPFGFDDDRVFVRHLIEDAGVAAIPPSVFYDRPEHGRRYVRFAFCKKRETLEAAVARLASLVRRETAV